MAPISAILVGKWSVGVDKGRGLTIVSFQFSDREPINLALSKDQASNCESALHQTQKRAGKTKTGALTHDRQLVMRRFAITKQPARISNECFSRTAYPGRPEFRGTTPGARAPLPALQRVS